MLGNFQYRDASLVRSIVGQGTTVFAVGASGVVWIILFRLSHIFHFSLSLGDAGPRTKSVGHLTRKLGPGFDTRSGHILSFLLPLNQEGQLSVTGESMCTKYWSTA